MSGEAGNQDELKYLAQIREILTNGKVCLASLTPSLDFRKEQIEPALEPSPFSVCSSVIA